VGREAIERETVKMAVFGTLKPSYLATRILRDDIIGTRVTTQKTKITGSSQTYTEPPMSQKMRSTYVWQRDLHKCNSSLPTR
jgi:hypothetical protein